MKRLIAHILVMSLLAGMLVACSDTGSGNGTSSQETTAPAIPDGSDTKPVETDPPTTTDQGPARPELPDLEASKPTVEPTSLDIVKDKKTDFTVVYSGSGYPQYGPTVGSEGANDLWTAILKKYKIDIKVIKDNDRAADSEAFEILVGDTNRPESDLALSFANGGNSFVIMAIGKKLVINGYSDIAVEEGVDYFLENVLNKAPDKVFTYSSESDYVSTPSSYFRGDLNCVGYPYAAYSIVLPASPDFHEERMARVFQYYVATSIGAVLPIVFDNEEDKVSEFEILIGDTNRTKSKVNGNEYVISVNGARVEINASSVFTMEYVKELADGEELFRAFLHNAEFDAGDLVRADLTERLKSNGNTSFDAKQGDYRIVSHNMYGYCGKDMPGYWNYYAHDYKAASQRNKMAAEIYLQLDADIILVQEFTTNRMRQADNHPLTELLAEHGYAEAVPSRTFTENGRTIYTATPVLYKTELFELVDNDCYKFEVGGGHDKFLTWAVLREKGSDNMLIVASVHHEYIGGDAGNANRVSQVKTVIEQLDAVMAQYGNCPVILAGDFNCTNSSEPYQKYVDAGFSDVHDIAEVKDNARGYYDGPYWDNGPDIPYMTMGTSFGNFSDAIDHMITKGSGIEFKTYDSLCDNASASISDHMPVVADFNFSK